jgi:3-hydroxybutyryl-CoA dehydrogenase
MNQKGESAMLEIKNVSVIGSGLMGQQIALNTAMYGYDVVINDNSEKALEKARVWAEKYLAGRVEKGKMTDAQAKGALEHLVFEPDLAKAVRDADLVIEAIVEDRAIKEKFFQTLDGLVRKDTIIATNSSYMTSSLFAGCVDNPSRLTNLHYFNPALVMKLTEIVQGPHTSEETVQALLDFSRKTGKDPVWLRKEIDGFIANRILRAVRNEACSLLEQGIATAQEIDTAAEKGLNYPMGPFRLMDLVGIDLSYLAQKRVFDETGVKMPGYDQVEAKYNAGEFGKKTGKGWYTYEK